MKTEIFKQSQEISFKKASHALQDGCVIGFPTDTVYGIGCLVRNSDAIERIYSIKKRDRLKAIPVLIAETRQLEEICENVPSIAATLAKLFWPGALTMILAKQPDLPSALTIYDTVGIRMPNHDWLRNLISACGPLAVTSANISGQPSLITGKDVYNALTGTIDMLIDGGKCEEGISSTVVDCTVSPIKILREGAIPAKVLQSIR